CAFSTTEALAAPANKKHGQKHIAKKDWFKRLIFRCLSNCGWLQLIRSQFQYRQESRQLGISHFTNID
ncbi:MAG: hypothetical protein VXY60_06520, partial [Pseudomonadota bacterium]|nr:hypothetical protein [Pseudomonadota bacterium]